MQNIEKGWNKKYQIFLPYSSVNKKDMKPLIKQKRFQQINVVAIILSHIKTFRLKIWSYTKSVNLKQILKTYSVWLWYELMLSLKPVQQLVLASN